mmetsp:Transcript_34298/g.56033  ORF Transcript_34298/g.56033 Transcript_34298/m.56033 type:complete len:102 (-) Transcript_34298:1246-1551(-)
MANDKRAGWLRWLFLQDMKNEEAIIHHQQYDSDSHASRHRRRGNSRARRPRSASYDGRVVQVVNSKSLHYLVDEEEGRHDAPLDDTMDSHSSSVAYSSAEF